MIDLKRAVTSVGLVMAAGLFAFSTGAAAAGPALVTANLNLRQGPGTNFAVITTIPGGSTVNVGACTGEWCSVSFGSRGGYVLARNLDMDGPAPVGVAPGAVVVEEPVVVGPPVYYYGGPRYWGPRYYYGGYYGGWRHGRRW